MDSEQHKKILDLIESGKRQGATLLAGGAALGDRGYYVQPTVFGNVQDDMDIAKYEVTIYNRAPQATEHQTKDGLIFGTRFRLAYVYRGLLLHPASKC